MVKAGDVVKWINVRATVLAVTKTGVMIGYEGRGLQEGEYVRRRVSAKQLTAA